MRTELRRKAAELAQLEVEFDGDILPLPVETTKVILLGAKCRFCCFQQIIVLHPCEVVHLHLTRDVDM